MGISTYDPVTATTDAARRPATRTVLVTGGSGFIGGYVRRALAQVGDRVRSIDVAAPANAADDHVVADLVDRDAMARAAEGTDTIVHLAAKHRFFGISPEEFRRVNVDGTRNVLDAATRNGVRRMVFYSSVAVYGDHPVPTTEDTPCRPNSPYGDTKLEAERLVAAWAEADGAREALIIRPTVVFGPGNRGNIYRLIRQIDRGLFFQVGPGTNVKSVAYVENLVAATRFLMDRSLKGLAVYNYADEPHMTFEAITALLHRQLGRRPPRVAIPIAPMLWAAAPLEAAARMARVDLPVRAALLKMNKLTHHSADRIRRAGFVPPVAVEEGVARMVRWYVEQRGSAGGKR